MFVDKMVSERSRHSVRGGRSAAVGMIKEIVVVLLVNKTIDL